MQSSQISKEDYELVLTLNGLRNELDNLHNCLDNITDPDLIDSYIFEIKAINTRYKFYLKMCKQKGIVMNMA